jgi:hypothetical protein
LNTANRGNVTLYPTKDERLMRKLPKLPLFDHSERTRIRTLPLPARRIARRYGFAASMALAIAQAAGFNCGDDK